MKYWVAASLLCAGVAAKTIEINVASIPLSFLPDQIAADVGDVLEFHFYPQNHSVVAGEYGAPCSPLDDGGFFSGFVPEEVFTVLVNDTEPIFFYCSQGQHCAMGMVGVVNPTINQTLLVYTQSAVGRNSSSPAEAFGGELGTASSANDTAGNGSGEAIPSGGAESTGGSAREGSNSLASSVHFSRMSVLGSLGVALLLAGSV
ncbi:hypothetical protein D7B24_007945 [Verticillium nonalfalfae]|uniref:Phytocyanin domain-containing protein n=1 Tax=Verticillium nonalfalfae TaxID=1051616 RepID=A0A3M9Y5S1_9PEZI|nr:uncharacterized protein D7B24_007945 [Verticillium nonalfalfae]RNJ55853.1 hypothetical protein D7B24_007945 [Verticillium nonalfalfae]